MVTGILGRGNNLRYSYQPTNQPLNDQEITEEVVSSLQGVALEVPLVVQILDA